jgi:hypothetical protein
MSARLALALFLLAPFSLGPAHAHTAPPPPTPVPGADASTTPARADGNIPNDPRELRRHRLSVTDVPALIALVRQSDDPALRIASRQRLSHRKLRHAARQFLTDEFAQPRTVELDESLDTESWLPWFLDLARKYFAQEPPEAGESADVLAKRAWLRPDDPAIAAGLLNELQVALSAEDVAREDVKRVERCFTALLGMPNWANQTLTHVTAGMLRNSRWLSDPRHLFERCVVLLRPYLSDDTLAKVYADIAGAVDGAPNRERDELIKLLSTGGRHAAPATDALVKFVQMRFAPTYDYVRGQMWRTLAELGPQTRELLPAALKQVSGRYAPEVGAFIASHCDSAQEAIATILEAVGDGRSLQHLRALQGLQRFGRDAAVELMGLLSEDPTTERAVQFALESLGPDALDAVPFLASHWPAVTGLPAMLSQCGEAADPMLKTLLRGRRPTGEFAVGPCADEPVTEGGQRQLRGLAISALRSRLTKGPTTNWSPPHPPFAGELPPDFSRRIPPSLLAAQPRPTLDSAFIPLLIESELWKDRPEAARSEMYHVLELLACCPPEVLAPYRDAVASYGRLFWATHDHDRQLQRTQSVVLGSMAALGLIDAGMVRGGVDAVLAAVAEPGAEPPSSMELVAPLMWAFPHDERARNGLLELIALDTPMGKAAAKEVTHRVPRGATDWIPPTAFLSEAWRYMRTRPDAATVDRVIRLAFGETGDAGETETVPLHTREAATALLRLWRVDLSERAQSQ